MFQKRRCVIKLRYILKIHTIQNTFPSYSGRVSYIFPEQAPSVYPRISGTSSSNTERGQSQS